MFSLDSLRSWLTAEAEVLRAKGYDVKVRHNDKGPKPGAGIEVLTNRFAGLLSTWISGEADIDIMDLQAKEVVVYKWGMRFDDTNYAAVFREFTDALLSLSDPDRAVIPSSHP